MHPRPHSSATRALLGPDSARQRIHYHLTPGAEVGPAGAATRPGATGKERGSGYLGHLRGHDLARRRGGRAERGYEGLGGVEVKVVRNQWGRQVSLRGLGAAESTALTACHPFRPNPSRTVSTSLAFPIPLDPFQPPSSVHQSFIVSSPHHQSPRPPLHRSKCSLEFLGPSSPCPPKPLLPLEGVSWVRMQM